MKPESSCRPQYARRALASLASLSCALGLMSAAACASSSSSSIGAAPTPAGNVSLMAAPSPDPRVGLKAGWFDAGQAMWNLKLLSNTPPSEKFINRSTPGDSRLTNSDLAFTGNYAIQGNYSGWQVWDISNPAKPTLRTSYVCPGSQSDVSVYRNLLFVSAEATSGRVDCGLQGVQDTVSMERARGIRIIDISDIARPRYITTIQTCRGSHTNTLVTDRNDPTNVYIYVSGSAGVRSPRELQGCSSAAPEDDPNSALFRIEVIQVPVAHPEQARIVSSPRIFDNLAAPPRHAEPAADQQAAAARAAARGGGAGAAGAAGAAGGGGGRAGGAGGAGVAAAGAPAAGRGAQRPGAGRGPTQCHDITVYPAIGLAGGACAGYGLLLDIRDVKNPKRIAAVADSNFSFWHSATFSNDGSKVLFSDEWGGGSQPRCRSSDKYEWGADAIFTISDNNLSFKSYYKMPAAQTSQENCVAHNGSLIPIPGRDVMVQSWYQGGISVFDWTDPSHPVEIAYFDRGPMDATRLVDAGHWSAYWYNGYIVGSEISRGLDLLELTPSAHLSQNEIDAAKLVKFDYFNAQEQPRLVWPASFVVARAYVDQLARNNGLAVDRLSAVRTGLANAEKLSGQQRRDALTQLASQLGNDARSAADGARVRMLASAVTDIARAQ